MLETGAVTAPQARDPKIELPASANPHSQDFAETQFEALASTSKQEGQTATGTKPPVTHPANHLTVAFGQCECEAG